MMTELSFLGELYLVWLSSLIMLTENKVVLNILKFQGTLFNNRPYKLLLRQVFALGTNALWQLVKQVQLLHL